MRVAVVGHVEWIELAVVERVPLAGEIVHASNGARTRPGAEPWPPFSSHGWPAIASS